MTDADMGTCSYAYNAFGELIRQTTAKGDRTDVSFDRLGRMVRRIDYVHTGGGAFAEESDAAWIFDTAANGLGQLHVEDTGTDDHRARDWVQSIKRVPVTGAAGEISGGEYSDLDLRTLAFALVAQQFVHGSF